MGGIMTLVGTWKYLRVATLTERDTINCYDHEFSPVVFFLPSPKRTCQLSSQAAPEVVDQSARQLPVQPLTNFTKMATFPFSDVIFNNIYKQSLEFSSFIHFSVNLIPSWRGNAFHATGLLWWGSNGHATDNWIILLYTMVYNLQFYGVLVLQNTLWNVS